MADNQKQLQEAYLLHRQGRSNDAIKLYEMLISKNPNNYDALHFLGIVKAELGQFDEAKQLLQKSLANGTVNLGYLENYASILFQSGAYEEAANVCTKAVRENSRTEGLLYIRAISLHKLGLLTDALDAFDALLRFSASHLAGYNEMAATLSELKRYDEALAAAEKALAINPRYVPAHLNKGNILASLKRYDAAISAYRNALSLNGNVPEGHLGLGYACRQVRRFEESLQAYDAALAFRPAFPQAWLGRANTLTEANRFDEALSAYDRALALDNKMADAWVGRGNALDHLGHFQESLAAYDKALTLDPESDAARLGRVKSLARSGDFEHALTTIDTVLERNPDMAAVWIDRGKVLNELKRYDEASAAYDKAIQLDPTAADAYWHKALVKLCIGDFASGWDLYEHRSESKEYVSAYPHLMALNVASRQKRNAFAGKKVAVFSEQGVGDEIMFASILPDLISDADNVFYQVDQRLVRLFQSAFPTARIISRGGTNEGSVAREPFDMVIQAGSLGYAYRQEPEAFSRRRYLTAEAGKIEKWQTYLLSEAGSRLKIGISWRGGTAQTRRDERSIDLERLRPLIERNDCYFVSLQYGNMDDELKKFNSGAPKVHRPLADFNDFDEFAALISALDLVISVQNTTIHMCGALGKTCWGMVPWRPEWRYGDRNKSMIWYSTVELFRQENRGDWNNVIKMVSASLDALIGERKK